uniref:Glycoside hydrolase family 5 domain-containing protein n=1 Tax=Pyrodinium bahamense TaxID=73915 RepID=A0A7S0AU02_9DINO
MKSFLGLWSFGLACGQAALRRNVRIDGQQFVLTETNQPIVLSGPNVVVKGPPYMPSVSGDTICNDIVDAKCRAAGTCSSCFTFNQADVDHIKALGWNSIRLGTVWAGAQPRDEDRLDPAFLERLHAVLNLTDANGLHVVLDNHGDMVGSAGCGNGVPMWFQQKAAPELLGKPLRTALPYSLVGQISVHKIAGYDHCGDDAAKWAMHAGDPNYNLVNECCQAMNSPNPGGLGFTTLSQKTMDYLVNEGPGRDYFVRFWRLLAEAVKGHRSAFAAELMNEPMTIHRRAMFDTWRACAEAITKIVPDMSVSICDLGEASLLPSWVTQLTGGTEDISSETVEWIKASSNVFYSWHYGSVPIDVENMQAISKAWNVPTFATETQCSQFNAAAAANISHSYWHYSSYCNTGPAFGNRSVPTDTFGACILGWAGGDSSHCARHIEHPGEFEWPLVV